MEFLYNNFTTILFYLFIGILIYINRKKFEFQGIVGLYKTKLGIEAMKRFVIPVSKTKQKIGLFLFNAGLYTAIFGATLQLSNIIINLIGIRLQGILLLLFGGAGYILFLFGGLLIIISIWFGQLEKVANLGIWVGYLGMAAIIAMVIWSIYQLIYNPAAPPAFTPVFPGFQVPGGPRIPLVQGLIALFIVVVVHEFAHGVVSKLYKIRIKSSGLAILGPIPAAFVEPDEKALQKASPKKQLGMYAAGPFSNILLGILMIIIINLGLILTSVLYAPAGVVIYDFNQSDQRLQEFEKGEIIQYLDEQKITTALSLQQALQNKTVNQTITIQTNNDVKQVTLIGNPNNESIPYIGFTLDQHVQGQGALQPVLDVIKRPYFWVMGNPYDIRPDPLLGWLGASLMGWIYILTLGIGLVNLLPIGPVDGGRMIKLALEKYFSQKTATRIWGYTSWILVAIIIILLIVPIVRNLL